MGALLLLRHAEAAFAAGLPDHDRPLTERGRAAAAALGARLRAAGPVDTALVSTALRARQTFEALALAPRPEVHEEPGLYATSPEAILGLVEAVAGNAASVLVVGHNPPIHGLALRLAGMPAPEALRDFRPGTLARFELTADRWADPDLAAVRLLAVDRPCQGPGRR